MQCIFLGDGEKCYASPPIPAVLGKYKPEEVMKTKYCKTEEFNYCPRIKATFEYFRARGTPQTRSS